MPEASHPQVFNIPVDRAFADALVDGLLRDHRGDRMALARGLILLPSNRAIQAVREAFVRRAEPGLLLPRLVAIGDLDAGEGIATALDPLDAEPVPPAIDPLQRQIMLASVVQRATGTGAAEAMQLASALGQTRDQMLIERVDPARLHSVDTGGIADHWTTSLRQLDAMLTVWPMLLAQTGSLDLAERRNRLLDRLAARWAASPPSGFVVAAGIDSAAPAIAGLLAVIARMPGGKVFISGLDQTMSAEEWELIGGDRPIEAHPQYHLRLLLDRMKVGRGEVAQWHGKGRIASLASREQLLSWAFMPPAHTASWSSIPKRERRLHGISALVLDTPAEEAQAIAIAIREALETPERTVALVTPDRDLARRVSALLGRWGIVADDSAGTPLSATPPGSLILAIAEAIAGEFSPVPLLALLKHPLVRADAGPETRLEWLDGVRSLDLALRGPRPAPGLDGIAAALREGDERTATIRAKALDWWIGAKPSLDSIAALATDLTATLRAISGQAEALAGERLWAGPAGQSAAETLAALDEGFARNALNADGPALARILRDVFSGIAIRPAYGGHPRVFIWGLIEARLQRADLMILGGLNEGVWPALPSPDPWLAPAVRHQLKLPGLERRIGMAAHDLAGALGARRVLMTRARRDARAPTTASRFWLRLETLTGGMKPPSMRYDLLARSIDRPAEPVQRATRPAPAPPVEDRPRKLSVTDVDRLSADPFAFYASKMLGLSRLDPLDAEIGPAWRGSMLHAVLEDWAKQDDYRAGALVERIRHALDGPSVHPLTRTMGLPPLIAAAEWIEAQVAIGRADGREPALSEESGDIAFAGVTIHGRADRIDRLADGRFAIVDYKSGKPPTHKQVESGFALQLGLLGLIAERGGFRGIGGKPGGFEYWSFARQQKSRDFGYLQAETGAKNRPEPADFVAETAKQFEVAVGKWLTRAEPFTAKRAPEYAYGEFDQLMRLEEWEGRG